MIALDSFASSLQIEHVEQEAKCSWCFRYRFLLTHLSQVKQDLCVLFFFSFLLECTFGHFFYIMFFFLFKIIFGCGHHKHSNSRRNARHYSAEQVPYIAILQEIMVMKPK